MADPLSPTQKLPTGKSPRIAAPLAEADTAVALRKPEARWTPLQLALRVALGFAGLTLLVGFFLPWLNVPGPGSTEGALVQEISGFNLAISSDLVGTPSALLWLVPVLGALLSAISFMGFRWSGQVAVGISVALIGYALYVLLRMFVQHTALGLWIVAGGVFVVLLLGVIAWMTGRDRPQLKESGPDDTVRNPTTPSIKA